MDDGHFYYLDDQYFRDFPDPFLMSNKETVSNVAHDRPCFYAFLDENTGLYWMIPVSSQIAKYRVHYDKKVARYHYCETIVFGSVMGYQKAFLIQNMCPTSAEYIKNEYIDGNSMIPVQVSSILKQTIISKARHVLYLQRHGHKLIFPDVLKIETELLNEKQAKELGLFIT